MPRGRRKGHKGQSRHFTNVEETERDAEKVKKEKEWRKMKGYDDDSDEEKEGEKEGEKVGEEGGAAKKIEAKDDLTDSSEEEEEEEEEEKEDKPKGIAHLIDIENPNRQKGRQTKKVTEIAETDSTTTLTRREREEVEKQQAKAHYMKMHLEGKTEEARADMARLALIRKQREDAQKKRDYEKKARDDAKTAAEKRLLEKKKQQK